MYSQQKGRLPKSPREDEGAHDHHAQKAVPPKDAAPQQETDDRCQDDGGRGERCSQTGEHGVEELPILESEDNEGHRSDDDQHHCGDHSSTPEVTDHIRHAKAPRVTDKEAGTDERCRG